MAKRIFIAFLTLLIMGTSNISWSQFSVGAGLSSYHGINMPVNRFGFNVFGEFPRTTNNTFSLRATFMLPVNNNFTALVDASNVGVQPPRVNVDILSKTNFFSIDGGTRYYFINDYDVGIAMYAGGYIKGILSSYQASYKFPAGVDRNDYSPYYVDNNGQSAQLDNFDRQFSVMFAFGGMIGFKYQLPTRGALTVDVGIEFVSRLLDPYMILGTEISQLSFPINVAYRFDWF